MSCNAKEWDELGKLQWKSYNITTYDAKTPSKLRVVPYPLDAFGRYVLPQCIWAIMRDYEVPKLLCFHGEEATTFMPKSGDQKGKAFAKCKRTTRSCNYFVSFTRIYNNLQNGWTGIETKVYPYKKPQVDRSAPHVTVKDEPSSSGTLLTPPSSPTKRRMGNEHEEDRDQKRVKAESPALESHASPPPLEAKRSQVKEELDGRAALPAAITAASASASATESTADKARRLLEHMLVGGGLPAEQFKAVFPFKECSDCNTMYYGNYASACQCSMKGRDS